MPAVCLAQSETHSVLRPYSSSAPRHVTVALRVHGLRALPPAARRPQRP